MGFLMRGGDDYDQAGMAVERYHKIIESMVAGGRPFVPTRETDARVQVERGVVMASALGGPKTAVRSAIGCDVIDAAGHHRPVHEPLLTYAYLAAATLGQANLPAADVRVALSVDIDFSAANGGPAAAEVWRALCAHVGSVVSKQAVGSDNARQLMRRLAAAQQPSGAFLRTTASDNPETHWYHELVILHAAADYAIFTGDGEVWAAVEQATMFHLNETEPDHATGQPWGLPAFVRVPGAEPLADASLHAVSAHQPHGASGVALLLLADTLYGLRHLTLAPENETR